MNDVRRVVTGRTIRGFADGFVSVLLAQYLTNLGFSPLRVGAIVTGTLLGSAALTLVFGLGARRATLGLLLVWSCALMAATGLGFATVTAFWPLLVIAVVGTLNPSSGDVSVFLPIEQAFIAHRLEGKARTKQYAIYNLGAILAGAVGALLSGVPQRVARAIDWQVVDVQQASFGLYVIAAFVIFGFYRSIPARERHDPEVAALDVVDEPADTEVAPASRRIVYELAALFSVDSAASGFVVTSMLVLWLHLRFDLSSSATAAVFFTAGLLGGCSQLLAPVLAHRIGMVRTMAYTHMPANVLLASAAFAPNGKVAVTLLLVRALFAQMDVPARQAFVMSVVPPHDRAAASSITNVPRSLASAATPLLAGALLAHSTFGWPLLIAGLTKLTYDIVLLALYRNRPESVSSAAR